MAGRRGPIWDQTDFSKEVAGLTSTMRSTRAGRLAATARDSTQPNDSPNRYTGLSGGCSNTSLSIYSLLSTCTDTMMWFPALIYSLLSTCTDTMMWFAALKTRHHATGNTTNSKCNRAIFHVTIPPRALSVHGFDDLVTFPERHWTDNSKQQLSKAGGSDRAADHTQPARYCAIDIQLCLMGKHGHSRSSHQCSCR